QRLENLERHLGVRRTLHVDADEEAGRLSPIEHAAHVVDARRAIDRQSELRQLERDVAADAALDHLLHDVEVLARRGVGPWERVAALAEVVHRDEQTALLDGPRRLDGFTRGLSRDKASREARGTPHAVPRRERLERLDESEKVKKSLRRAVE